MDDRDYSRDFVLREKPGELSRVANQDQDNDSEEDIGIKPDIKGRPIHRHSSSRRKEPQASRVHEKPLPVYETGAALHKYQTDPYGNPYGNGYVYPDYPQYPPQGPKPRDSVRRRPLNPRPSDTKSSDYAKSTGQASREAPIHHKVMGLDEYPRVNLSAREGRSSTSRTRAAGDSDSMRKNLDRLDPSTSQPRRDSERRINTYYEQPAKFKPSYEKRRGDLPSDRRRIDNSSDERAIDSSSDRRRNDSTHAVYPDPYPQPRSQRDRNGREPSGAAQPPPQPGNDQQLSRQPRRAPRSNPEMPQLPGNATHIDIFGRLVPREHFIEGTRPCLAARITRAHIQADPERFKTWFGPFIIANLKRRTFYPLPGPCGDGSHPIDLGKPHPHWNGKGVVWPEDGRCIAGECFQFPHPQGPMIPHGSYWDPRETRMMTRCKEGWCYPLIKTLPHYQREYELIWHTCWCGCGRQIYWDGCIDLFCFPEMWIHVPESDDSRARGVEQVDEYDAEGSDAGDTYRRVSLWVRDVMCESPEPILYGEDGSILSEDDNYEGEYHRKRR